MPRRNGNAGGFQRGGVVRRDGNRDLRRPHRFVDSTPVRSMLDYRRISEIIDDNRRVAGREQRDRNVR